MKGIIKILLLLILGTWLFQSCGREGQRGNGDDNYFSSFRTFRDASWQYGDTLVIEIDTLRDSSATGPLNLSLRHTNGFRWGNLWLEVRRQQDSATVADTFNIPLADLEGNWYGHGTGPSRQLNYTLYPEITLNRRSSVSIRHIMRVDTLEGIEQLGIVFLGMP